MAHLDTATAMQVVTHAADVTLLIDDRGIVADLAYAADDLAGEGLNSWIGKPWIETVTVESKPKVEALLQPAKGDSDKRWRQVNHPSPRGEDMPLSYLTFAAKSAGWSVAIGRDLRAAARMQQRLIDAQAAMERDYARLREAESRYQILFQMANDGVLVTDARNLKISDANRAAVAVLGEEAEALAGRSLLSLFSEQGAEAVTDYLTQVRQLGSGEEIDAWLVKDGAAVHVSATFFRQTSGSHFLIRVVSSQAQDGGTARDEPRRSLEQVVEALPDAFVVADADMNILTANEAFLTMAQVASEKQARAMNLARFVGRPGVDLNVLRANLKEQGSVRHFATILRSLHGLHEEVEISAVAVEDGRNQCFGFAIRSVGRRLIGVARPGREMQRSVEQLTDLVGRVALKEIVRETTDLIERMCIEAALDLTGDNRASAAEMLGLSRQSLYSKLHRHSLGDLSTQSRN